MRKQCAFIGAVLRILDFDLLSWQCAVQFCLVTRGGAGDTAPPTMRSRGPSTHTLQGRVKHFLSLRYFHFVTRLPGQNPVISRGACV